MLQRAETFQARTVRLHLVNGTPNGIVCANSNRGVLAFRAPRSRLKELCRRTEADCKGVYVLSGQDPQDPVRRKLYIGESDCLRLRLPIQERIFDFFDHVVIAVGKDDTFSKDHFRFVESELIRLAGTARAASLMNENDPRFDRLSEGDRIEASDFLDELLLLLPILGFDAFRPVDLSTISIDASLTTFETDLVGTTATARETDDGFIVLSGSTARAETTKAFPPAMAALRDSLLRDGKLIPHIKPGYYQFASDISFTSPSAAATFVAGTSVSGPQAWKSRETGQTYKEWREAQFDPARVTEPA